MTNSPKPPVNRRRIVVTMAIVAGATLFTWWFWPRGDIRFVGTWELWDENHEVLEGLATFERSGRRFFDFSGVGQGSAIAWKVSGDQLIFGWVSPTGCLPTIVDEILMLAQRLSTHVVLLDGNHYDILSCAADKIELRLSGTNSLRTLRRKE